MTKEELIKEMAGRSGLSAADAQKALGAFMETVTETLAKGDQIQLIGFGTYQVSRIEAKTARNPKDGSEIPVPAHNRVSFKVGSKLKAAVNNG